MLLGPIVNLVLIVFYLLLGYITFKELSNKRCSPETHERILLKWMISAVFFSGFWVFESLFFFIPTSIFKLPLGLWILMPQFYGEYWIYNMFADIFEHLEYYFRSVRNFVASNIFGVTFTLSTHSFGIIKKFIPTDKLKEFQNNIRDLDKEINDELRLRKTILQQMSSKDYKSPTNRNSDETLRDSTVIHGGSRKNKPPTYFRPPTGQIYTPVGMFTKSSTSVLETSHTNLTDDQPNSGDLRGSISKTAKHSKKSSKDMSAKKAMNNLGRGSSYIDPKLSQRMNDSQLSYQDKDDYKKTKKSAKKNN